MTSFIDEPGTYVERTELLVLRRAQNSQTTRDTMSVRLSLSPSLAMGECECCVGEGKLREEECH